MLYNLPEIMIVLEFIEFEFNQEFLKIDRYERSNNYARKIVRYIQVMALLEMHLM